MTTEALLEKLDKLKRTGPHRWLARCPAHNDQGPSLSVRETDTGSTLVHCFAGCSVHEIVQAVGLELSDLFPPRGAGDHARPERRPFHAADALRAIGFEALVVCAAAAALATGEPLSAVDRERLLQAGERIQSALSGVGL